MFLIRRMPARDDSGSALVAVIGMVAVAALVTTVVTASTVQALNYSTSTRAGVQSTGAADAGVAYLAARLAAEACEASAQRNYGQVYTSQVLTAEAAALGQPSLTLADMGVRASDPYFAASMQYRSTTAGAAWATGCPPTSVISNQVDYQVRIQSTGYAAGEGTGGVSGLDARAIEAVYAYRVRTREDPPPTQLAASGPAVYAYSSEGFGGSGTLISVNGSQPGVVIKEGTVTCNGASAGIVDIVAGNGDITVNGSCKVDGNVWATGSATIDGGTGVKGSVISKGLTATVAIGGSVWSAGDVRLSWGSSVGGTLTSRSLDAAGTKIAGNVVADGSITANQVEFGSGINATGAVTLKQLTLAGKTVARALTLDGGVTVNGDADIYGKAEATGGWASSVRNLAADAVNFTGDNKINGRKTIRSASSVPAGAITQNPPTPTRPAVPDWIDFGYVPADWTGFTEVVLSGACTPTQLRTALSSVSGPALVNALGCSGGVSIGGSDQVALNRDVAIFANRFELGGSGRFTSTADARLWLIQPDTVKAAQGQKATPDCGSRSYAIGGGFGFDDRIQTMVYTPCRMDFASSTVMTGQIYAGKVTINGGSQLRYVRVGLPGVDLDTGGSPSGGTAPPPTLVGIGGELRDLLDYRDAPGS